MCSSDLVRAPEGETRAETAARLRAEHGLEEPKKTKEVAPAKPTGVPALASTQDVIAHYEDLGNRNKDLLGRPGARVDTLDRDIEDLDRKISSAAYAHSINEGLVAEKPKSRRNKQLFEESKAELEDLQQQKATLESARKELKQRDLHDYLEHSFTQELKGLRDEIQGQVEDGLLTQVEAEDLLSRAQRTGNLEDAADLIHNALHQRFVESKKRKALPAVETKAVTVEPVVEPLVKQIEATTVPKKRGRPSKQQAVADAAQ